MSDSNYGWHVIPSLLHRRPGGDFPVKEHVARCRRIPVVHATNVRRLVCSNCEIVIVGCVNLSAADICLGADTRDSAPKKHKSPGLNAHLNNGRSSRVSCDRTGNAKAIGGTFLDGHTSPQEIDLVLPFSKITAIGSQCVCAR